jgi:hypothetical protein
MPTSISATGAPTRLRATDGDGFSHTRTEGPAWRLSPSVGPFANITRRVTPERWWQADASVWPAVRSRLRTAVNSRRCRRGYGVADHRSRPDAALVQLVVAERLAQHECARAIVAQPPPHQLDRGIDRSLGLDCYSPPDREAGRPGSRGGIGRSLGRLTRGHDAQRNPLTRRRATHAGARSPPEATYAVARAPPRRESDDRAGAAPAGHARRALAAVRRRPAAATKKSRR